MMQLPPHEPGVVHRAVNHFLQVWFSAGQSLFSATSASFDICYDLVLHFKVKDATCNRPDKIAISNLLILSFFFEFTSTLGSSLLPLLLSLDLKPLYVLLPLLLTVVQRL